MLKLDPRDDARRNEAIEALMDRFEAIHGQRPDLQAVIEAHVAGEELAVLREYYLSLKFGERELGYALLEEALAARFEAADARKEATA